MFFNLYKMKKIYSVKEASNILKIKERVIQLRCKKDNLKKFNGRYIITEDFIKKWLKNEPKTNETNKTNVNETNERNISDEQKLKEAIELITIAAAKQNIFYRVFTEDEYSDIIGKMELVESQNEHIQYLRNRIDKQDEILKTVFKTIEQRNYIDAKKNES